MKRRGFNPGTKILLNEFPNNFVKDWNPTKKDSQIIRKRIYSRLIKRTNNKPGQGYYRYEGELIPDVKRFGEQMKKSKTFYV
jgi:hypothetical protein